MTKTYHNGPIDNSQRRMTDCFCAIVFLLFNLSIFGVAIYAWTSSNFSKMTTPYDPDGKGCGVDYPDYPFIYFASPHPDVFSQLKKSLFVTTCVKKCPSANDQVLQCMVNSVVKACTPVNSADNIKAVQIYESTPVRGSICMPTQQKIETQIYQALGAEAATQKVASLSRAWVIVVISFPVCILLSMIFFFMMRLTASFFIYLLFGTSILSLIVLGMYFIVSPTNQYTSFVNNIFHSHVFSNVLGVICIVFGIAIGISVFCFRNKLELASLIVKVSTRFVNENCRVMLLQIGIFAVMNIFILLWFLQAMGFYSMGEPQFEANSLPFQHFKSGWQVKALGFVHIFYFFWGMVFFVQSGDFLVAGTVTSWYFQRNEPYKESLKRYFGYHIGSVCMGSFLIAIFGFIKFLNELLTPNEGQSGDGCMGTCRKIWKCCCCLCVNWIFNWVNNGAYTFIHLSGDPYCTSAIEVFAVRIKDMVWTGVVSILSVILIRIGITSLTCLVAYAMVRNLEPYKTEVTDASFLMIGVGLIGFTISSLFVSLYSQAMESISVCCLIDKESGGGQDKCPYELKNFLYQAKLNNHTVME